MKIDFKEINTEEFYVKEGMIGEYPVRLVNPKSIAVHWTKDSLKFRSSVWDMNGEPVSLGFKKFYNLGENIQLVPDPTSLIGTDLVNKVDGSCLLVSKYKKNLVVRTRGTLDASLMDNGSEIYFLKQAYPTAFDNAYLNTENCTFIYEWTTPTNRIVIDYGDRHKLSLIGVISHIDYSYHSQDSLDALGLSLNLPRPLRYNFDSFGAMLTAVEHFKDLEGLCIYFNLGQDIKKVKGAWYLALNRFKSDCTLDNILDLFLANGMPDHDTFKGLIEKEFDFECMTMAMPFVSQICEAHKKVQGIVKHMESLVYGMDGSSKSGRKQAAAEIHKAYGPTGRASFIFTLLDKKELTKEHYKKLIMQSLE